MNPFAEMIELFRPEEQALFLRLGTVLTLSPLTVDTAGLSVRAAYCSADLLEPDPETGKTPLQPGDRAVLLSDGDQVFYILCRVVEA